MPTRATGLVGALLAVQVACADSEAEPIPAPTGVSITDQNNFSASSGLDVPSVEVAAGVDVEICWTEVTQDLQCHPVDAAEQLDNMTLLRFLNLSESEVEAKLTSGQLTMAQVDGFLEYNTVPGSTCAMLSDLNFFGTPIDIEQEFKPAAEHVYMLLFTEGTTPGVGARSMLFLRPTSSATTNQVSVPSGCGMLEFSADLSSLEPIVVPAEGPWLLDWRSLTRDGGGHEVPFSSIDSVLLAFYAGRDLTYLERNIFDIEVAATELWELGFSGQRTADLAEAVHRDTQLPFAGFDDRGDGVWLLGLRCSTCANPAPVLLTVVQPEAG